MIYNAIADQRAPMYASSDGLDGFYQVIHKFVTWQCALMNEVSLKCSTLRENGFKPGSSKHSENYTETTII